jgi:asparagine synthase (glutamine-hydrolysing)
MCGIAGIITRDRRQAEDAIRRMMPSMTHRGPDDEGEAVLPVAMADGLDGFAAFGFRRLSILDLSRAGHQPMVNHATGDCLIFNGEIYNFRELRGILSREGVEFRSSSDSEVLLHALGRYGEEALERLEGMYAFAFYSARDRSVLLARDPLGVKPLYVARANGAVLFASEVRTLLASNAVPRDLDQSGIAAMLAFGSVQAERTVFAAIEEFPAGHVQRVGGSARRFWQFPRVTGAASADAVDRTRHLVADAVRRHLVADVPVGVFLSAGIDSTVIAACAAEAGSDVTAFTVGIGAQYADDEVAVAAATAKGLGVAHEVVPIDEQGLQNQWPRWIESLDSPSIDGFNTYVVTKALADRGIKVGLSGLGADELFGGYDVFRKAPKLESLMKSLSWMPKTLVAGVAERMMALRGRVGAAEKLADILAGDSRLPAIVMGLRRVLSNRRLAGIGLTAPGPATTDLMCDDAFNIVSCMEIANYMRNTLLRDADANSMSHSLELRVPFLDMPVVNETLALPAAVKAPAGAAPKYLLRKAFADVLPADVTQRRKTGFTLPVGYWMRGSMRPFCEHAIDSLAGIPFIHGKAVRETWEHYLRTPASMLWTRPFSLVVLGAYLSRHARGSS